MSFTPKSLLLPLSLVAVLTLSACSEPTDIVLGEKPIETVSANGEKLRKLAPEERDLLMRFLVAREVTNVLPGLSKDIASTSGTLTGKTVGEALQLARQWDAEMLARKAAEAEAQRQAAALKERALAERRAAQDRINSLVTLALVKKQVLDEDLMAGRYTDLLKLTFAIENKSDKAIKLLKGRAYFSDLSGDPIGELDLQFDEGLPPNKLTTTSGGIVWRIDAFMSGYVERIAGTNGDNLQMKFEPESVVFSDGTVVKAPAAKD